MLLKEKKSWEQDDFVVEVGRVANVNETYRAEVARVCALAVLKPWKPRKQSRLCACQLIPYRSLEDLRCGPLDFAACDSLQAPARRIQPIEIDFTAAASSAIFR